jgi:CysZ protein
MNKVNHILTSFTTPIRVLAYISSRPKTIILIVIPQIINFFISIFVFIFIFNWVSNLISSIEVWEFLKIFLKIFGGIVSFLLTGLILLSIGSIVSSPFNSIIVEQIFEKYGIEKVRDYSGFKLIIFEVFRAIKFEIKKLIIVVGFFVFTLILHAIPILGSMFFGIINFLFAMYINGLDLNDTSNELLRRRFREKSKLLFQNLDYFGPFLAYSTMFLSLPFINILYLPFAIIGSTLIYVEIYEQNKRTQG